MCLWDAQVSCARCETGSDHLFADHLYMYLQPVRNCFLKRTMLFISWMFKVWLYLDPPNFESKSYSTFYLALIILLPHIRWDPTMKDWWHFVVTQAKRNRRTVHWNSSLQQSGSRKVIHSLLYQHLHSQVLNFTLPKGVPSLIKRF